jgi:hypothetical protein
VRRAWPIASTQKSDYEAIIRVTRPNAQEQTHGLAALNCLWVSYRAYTAGAVTPPATMIQRLADYVFSPGGAVAFVIVLIMYILLTAISSEFLGKLSTIQASRSLITFLFGVTTVGIALIVILGSLGDGEKETRETRFQQGKDILTVLIGVFGTIIGFYFGSATQTGLQTPQTPQTEVTPSPTSPSLTPRPATSPTGNATRTPTSPTGVPPTATSGRP